MRKTPLDFRNSINAFQRVSSAGRTVKGFHKHRLLLKREISPGTYLAPRVLLDKVDNLEQRILVIGFLRLKLEIGHAGNKQVNVLFAS